MGSIKYQANKHCTFGNMDMTILGKNYQLNLNLDATKPPVWHREDGKLKMCYTNKNKEVTYYYALTNIALEGEFILDGKK